MTGTRVSVTSAALQPRGLRPAAELAADKPHGTRIKYVGGCRCLPCRMANANYSKECAARKERGEGNGLVPATVARAHILWLSQQGVGNRAVAAASDVGKSILVAIRTGKRTRVRAQTAKRILAVTPAALSDGALVPAGQTWRYLNILINDEGFTKTRLAQELGYKTRALQIKKDFVFARTALAVEKLWRRYQQ